MLEKFSGEARAAVAAARERAAASAAPAVEPEHLLLALGPGSGTGAGRVLARLGLDDEGLLEAVRHDAEALLEAVGVRAERPSPDRGRPARSRPRFAPATKRALERSLRVAVERRDRRIGSEHLLLGVARTETARVGRLLAREGITPETITAALDEL
jgi:ATP-dependent Clp protease ATP-binding subunit ClpA